MNIGEVSRASNLSVKTVRYYEDIGLISPARSGNGYREFNTVDIHKLSFLQRARSLGFSVEECRALLELYKDTERPSREVKAIARTRLDDIERKLAELNSMKVTLLHLIENCAGDNRPDCPILDDLAGITKSESD